ncbi:YigZ family protein [Subdoligranulum sp. DSM 109015]|uniref:YigZ family protein n=1 Tax=Gemmiger gallinarum TaxID=2779354 RepID=A0ABR9R1J1_9FIRM|nr:YigZ family protein [Gemmiger gallinarum]MBE5036960.1 YigZ family protein [Gemmiger gallinarum]
MAEYRTISGTSTFEYEEKRSRFIGLAAFADTEEKALAVLSRVRAENRTARHNVYAYVLREGGRSRYSDDGEPAKTAGTPVLEAIGHAGLSDVIVVVTRYFGGILLGTGGLVRAYTAAASGALARAEIVTMREVVACRVRLPYSLFEQAQRLILAAGGKCDQPEFDDAVTLCWKMPAGTEGELLGALRELSRGSAQIQVSPPEYAPF